jgi:SAM-dependent methyltransferase
VHSNEPIPFTDRSFAAVISLDVVLHLRERNALFSEVARVLTPARFNERALERAGLTVVQVEDQTDNLLKNAAGRMSGRLTHRGELEAVEGMEEFDREHRYL